MAENRKVEAQSEAQERRNVEVPVGDERAPRKVKDGVVVADRPFDTMEEAVESLREEATKRGSEVVEEEGTVPTEGMGVVTQDEVDEVKQRLAMDPSSVNYISGPDYYGDTYRAAQAVEAEVMANNAASIAIKAYLPEGWEHRDSRLLEVARVQNRREVDIHLTRTAELRRLAAKGVVGTPTYSDPAEIARLKRQGLIGDEDVK